MGVSAPSLHRESTIYNSMISLFMHMGYASTVIVA